MVLARRVIYGGGADYILVPKLGPGFEGFDNSHHVAGRTTCQNIPPINHGSFEEHPPGCKVSGLRAKSRGRLTRLNANTKSGRGGRRRTMFQYGSCDRFISSALRAAAAKPSTVKTLFNLFIWNEVNSSNYFRGHLLQYH